MSTADIRRTAPHRNAPHTGTICAPWDGVRLRVPAQPRVSFSHLPAPRTGAAVTPTRLRTPWDDADLRLDAAAVRPVSFSSLAAPVAPAPVPAQRPGVGEELFSGSR